MPNLIHRLTLFLLLLALGSSCKSDPVYTLTLTAGTGTTVAGVPIGYSLEVTNEKGVVQSEVDLSLEVTPSEGVTFGEGTVTFTRAVPHTIKATATLADGTAVGTCRVLVSPGQADHISLTVLPDVKVAGSPVTLEPRLEDAYDNAVSPAGSFGYSATPSAGVTIDGQTFHFTVATDYTILVSELSTDLRTSITLTVLPAQAKSVSLLLSGNRIAPGDTVEAQLLGTDAYGNIFPLEATYEVTPPDGVKIEGASLEFNREGNFTVQGLSGSLSAQEEVTVDSTPPRLEVTAPARALFLSDPTVSVEGWVEDKVAGMSSVRVNGVEATLEGDGFTLDYPLAAGTNILVVEATDLNGNASQYVTSTLYAPNVTPLGTTFSKGLYGQLNTGAIAAVTDMLEDLLDPEWVKEELMAANPLLVYAQESPPFTATVTLMDIGYSSVEGKLTPKADEANGSLQIEATFTDLFANFGATGVNPTGDYSLYAYLTASSASASAKATVTVVNGVAEVSMPVEAITVALSGFELTLSDELLDILASILESQIELALEEALVQLIATEVPPLLADTLNYLNFAETTSQEVGGQTLSVTLQAALETVRFNSQGATLGESVYLGVESSGGYDTLPGAPQVGASNLVFPSSPGYYLTASLDLLNYALFSLWSTGVLAYSFELEEAGQSMTATAWMPLPPVVQPASDPHYTLDATAGDIAFDIYTDASDDAPTYQLAVSLVIPATVISSQGGLTVSVDFGDPIVLYQVVAQPEFGLDASALGDVVQELVVQLLFELEAEVQNIAIPEFEGYQLSITQVYVLGSGWGYLAVGGDLVEAAPSTTGAP